MLKDVVAILGSELYMFELGVVTEVFGIDRSEDGLPVFDFAVCATTPDPVRAQGGVTIRAAYGLERAASADLVVVPAWRTDGAPPPPDVVAMLHAALHRGARVLSVCSGAFLLAGAGLLGGRRATCHWNNADDLLRQYPEVTLECDRLYVEDGPVVTSAGTAAGIDACLHIVRSELGARVANGIARRMVVPPHRDGGQAQYVETPVPARRHDGDDMSALLEWLQGNLHAQHSVAALARRVHLSPRTFTRRFAASTGTAPHQWLIRQRVLLARQLLEEDSLGIEEIARRTGFGTADLLRHHFTQQLGTAPSTYRRRFSLARA